MELLEECNSADINFSHEIVLYSFGFCVFAQLWLKASVKPKPGLVSVPKSEIKILYQLLSELFMGEFYILPPYIINFSGRYYVDTKSDPASANSAWQMPFIT